MLLQRWAELRRIEDEEDGSEDEARSMSQNWTPPSSPPIQVPRCCEGLRAGGGVWWIEATIPTQSPPYSTGWVIISNLGMGGRLQFLSNVFHCPYCGRKFTEAPEP